MTGLGSAHEWGLFLASAFLAEVLGTMAGFGAATILTPVAALFMDMKTAIAVVACFHLFGNGSRLFFFWRSIHWTTWWQFGLTGILFSVVGARVSTQLSSVAVQRCFGVFLLLYVGSALFAPDRARLPTRPATLVGGGILSGFLAGLLGTGGAIRSACLLAFGLPKEAYLGTSAAIALIVDATRLPVYVTSGLIPPTMLWGLASLVLVAFAGAALGQRLVRSLSTVVLRRIILVMLAVMGLKLLG